MTDLGTAPAERRLAREFHFRVARGDADAPFELADVLETAVEPRPTATIRRTPATLRLTVSDHYARTAPPMQAPAADGGARPVCPPAPGASPVDPESPAGSCVPPALTRVACKATLYRDDTPRQAQGDPAPVPRGRFDSGSGSDRRQAPQDAGFSAGHAIGRGVRYRPETAGR